MGSRSRSSAPARLKKPFSADSLFSCLLEVSYGNTQDLSPTRALGHGWDLDHLPAEVIGRVKPGSSVEPGQDGEEQAPEEQAWPDEEDIATIGIGSVEPSFDQAAVGAVMPVKEGVGVGEGMTAASGELRPCRGPPTLEPDGTGRAVRGVQYSAGLPVVAVP